MVGCSFSKVRPAAQSCQRPFASCKQLIWAHLVFAAMQLNHSAFNSPIAPTSIVAKTGRKPSASLKNYTLAVREKVCPQKPFAIGLRLGERAAVELSERDTLLAFHRWLEKTAATFSPSTDFLTASFTARASRNRSIGPTGLRPSGVAYTNLLFDLLAEICPPASKAASAPCPARSRNFIRPPRR